MEEEIKEICFIIRKEIENLKGQVKSLKDHGDVVLGSKLEPKQIGEMLANIMLTYRHLEDARMRLGKVCQARDGGKSVYPR